MEKCSVRWRPSGGRGEFEFVPSDSLKDKRIAVAVQELDALVQTEVFGAIRDGKPRLRKDSPNDRLKMHLVPLVMAMARLPEPRREDITGAVTWPLENKTFLVSEMDFEIISDDGITVVLGPLIARILHSDQVIDLKSRFISMRNDLDNALASSTLSDPELRDLVIQHVAVLREGINSPKIRQISDRLIDLQRGIYGDTNVASITEIKSAPYTPLEADIIGKEGKILVRLHSKRERDPGFVRKAKARFKALNGGVLFCECCGHDPLKIYGPRGDSRIEAHHKRPVEEMLPDTEVRPEDLAMVCPNCHDIIHAKRPWATVEDMKTILLNSPYN